MTLSNAQQRVLRNSLAWTDVGYTPTARGIEQFFAWTDKGERPAYPIECVELIGGWRCHYGSEFEVIDDWASGHSRNPPIEPPAAWLYDAYWRPQDGGWVGWANLLISYITDALVYSQLLGISVQDYWLRKFPAFERAYSLSSRFHVTKRMKLKEMQP